MSLNPLSCLENVLSRVTSLLNDTDKLLSKAAATGYHLLQTSS